MVQAHKSHCSIWSRKLYNTKNPLREIPEMIRTPVKSSCLSSLLLPSMCTSFWLSLIHSNTTSSYAKFAALDPIDDEGQTNCTTTSVTQRSSVKSSCLSSPSISCVPKSSPSSICSSNHSTHTTANNLRCSIRSMTNYPYTFASMSVTHRLSVKTSCFKILTHFHFLQSSPSFSTISLSSTVSGPLYLPLPCTTGAQLNTG